MTTRPNITTLVRVCAMAVLALAASCGGNADQEPASRLTKAQRDSVLATSPLPGAGVVGRALEVADSANARTRQIDASAR